MAVRAREEGKAGEGDSEHQDGWWLYLEKFTEKVMFKLTDGESRATK